MDFSNPLDNLPSGLEATALAVVARVEVELTGRQIARLAEAGSADNIRRALLRLAEVGLVIAKPLPSATFYSANREHLLWPSIDNALSATDRLRSKLERFVAMTGPEGVSVSLYGSIARGDSHAHSDVDLVVVFADGSDRRERDEFLHDLESTVFRWTGNDAQVYDIDRSDLARQRAAGDPLVESWLADESVVAGPGIRALVA